MPRRTRDRENLTLTALKEMPLPAKGKKVFLWDTKLHGLAAVKTPTGSVSFVYLHPTDPKRQKITLGSFPPMTPEQARDAARVHAGRFAKGQDPATERRAERKNAAYWAEWVETYLEHVKEHKKVARHDVLYLKGTIDENGKVVAKSLAMREWERLKLAEITNGKVNALFLAVKKAAAASVEQRITSARERLAAAEKAEDAKAAAEAQVAIAKAERIERPGNTTANRWLAAVRACFAEAVRRQLLVTNPAEMTKPYKENAAHHDPLSAEEMARLRDAVEALPDRESRVLLQLLMSTGCRKSEALRMRWEDLHFDQTPPLWIIPSPKAGNPQGVPIHSTTREALDSLTRRSAWVFPSPQDPNKHREDLRKLWGRVLRAAGIASHRVHDLRHTFGLTVRQAHGTSAARRLLRHSDERTTMRVYAPYDVGELAAVLDDVLGARAKVVADGSNVVPIGGRKAAR